MKRAIKVFLIFWMVLFFISFFTAKFEITFLKRIGYTAVMAAITALLSLGGGKQVEKPTTPNRRSRKISVIDIKVPNSPKVVYEMQARYEYLN